MTNIFMEVLYCHVIYQYHVYFQQYLYTVMWSINIMSIFNNICILSCDLSSTCLFLTIFLYCHHRHVYFQQYFYTIMWSINIMSITIVTYIHVQHVLLVYRVLISQFHVSHSNVLHPQGYHTNTTTHRHFFRSLYNQSV